MLPWPTENMILHSFWWVAPSSLFAELNVCRDTLSEQYQFQISHNNNKFVKLPEKEYLMKYFLHNSHLIQNKKT